MNAFEFGYAVGGLEKQAVNFRLAGNLPATIAGQAATGAPFRTFARQGIEAAKRIGNTAMRDIGGALPRFSDVAPVVGAAGLVGGALAGTEGAGRGVGYATGAGIGGGLGAGIGKSVSRMLPQKYQAAAQLAGGGIGTALGALGANRMMGPSGAAKQAGAIADTAKSVMDKGKQVAGKAEGVAKGVANKAVDIGAKAQQGFDKWRKTPNPIVKATSAGGKSAAAMFGETIGRPG